MTSRSLCGELAGGGVCAVPDDTDIRLRSTAAMPRGHFGGLLFDFNSAPKSHVVFDVAGRGFWIWIVPGRVLILLSVDQKTVVACLSLPWTGRYRRTGAKIFSFEGAFREVKIS